MELTFCKEVKRQALISSEVRLCQIFLRFLRSIFRDDLHRKIWIIITSLACFKVGALKSVSPFIYDLSQIPYVNTVEVTGIKGLDLIDEYLKSYGGGSEHCTGDDDQNHHQEEKMQKGKTVVLGGLTNNWKRRKAKGKGENERNSHLNGEFQRIARRDKKAFLSDQCKKIEENKRLEISSRKVNTKGTFHAKMGTIKDRNGMNLTEAEDIKKRWQEYTELY